MRGPLLSQRVSLRGSLPRQQVGEGQAWLIFDAGGELFKYQCYRMGGHCDDHRGTYRACRGPRANGFSRSRHTPNTTASRVGAAVPVRARAA